MADHTDITPNGEYGDRSAGSWNTAWFEGELADADTWQKASRYMSDNVKDATGAKVFQGTASGSPAIFIFYRS